MIRLSLAGFLGVLCQRGALGRLVRAARWCAGVVVCAGLAVAAGAAEEWRVAAGVDYVVTQGLPNIGNIGVFVSRRINHASPSLRVSRNLAPNWALELGYRYTPTYAARMEASTSGVFPPGGPLQVITPYELSQRAHTLSLGPTWSFAVLKRLRGTIGVFAAVEAVGSRIDYLDETTQFVVGFVGSVGATGVGSVPVSNFHGRSFRVSRRGDTSYRHNVRGGARLGLEYDLGGVWSLEATGTLIDSVGAAGAYVGLGLAARF